MVIVTVPLADCPTVLVPPVAVPDVAVPLVPVPLVPLLLLPVEATMTTVLLPAAVGVPDMVPVAPLILNPAGSPVAAYVRV
jgi:hypothetical protein